MCIRVDFNIPGFGFLRDERGSASTEWMVAVSIVVAMAVPVLGVVGNGTDTASNDIVVSIEDTDSFGGDEFHGDEGSLMGQSLDDLEEDVYIPGADMGVGFPDGSGETKIGGRSLGGASSGGADARRFASAGDAARRDKSVSSAGTIRRSVEEELVTTPRQDRRPFAVPTPPVLVSQKLRVSDDHCVEDIVAEIPTSKASDIVPVKVVLSSGR